MLYIHGQCGVGKTALSSFLWKSVRTVGQAGEAGAITTLYFSFLREDKRRNSIRSMLSSIIYQLLACRPQIFLSFWNHDVWIKWYKALTVEELWIIFRSLISSPIHDGIICIIDAIDQCDIRFDTTLQELLAFSASREAKFKMVVTSRVSPERLHLLPRFSINLDLQKEKEMDLNASTKIYSSDLLQGNAAFLGLEQDIVEKLQNRGTHLDVFLGFESLKSPTLRSTPWSMKTLKSLSYGPSDVCDRVLNEFAELPPWACTALSWIVHAFRPLTFEELSIAIAICDTTTSYSEIEIDVPRDIARDLKQVFGGMLSFNYDEIRFVHQSVKEYLLTHLTSPPSQDHLSLSLTHTDLAKRCLAYLSFADLEDRSPSEPVSWDYSPPRKSDFLGYATEYWPEHYQKAEERDRLYGDVFRFLENEEHLERWNKSRSVKRHIRDWPPHPISSLQSAAELGLTEIVTMLLLQDDGTRITHNDKEAALDMAVDNSHLEAAIQLLNSGTTSRRAVSLAARHGNTELVKQLIDRNALEASEIDGLSPFHEAALRGHTSVIGTLLEAGAIPKSINISEVTPFSLAVKGGQLAALQQLLGANRTVALADDTDLSLLHLAAREGHLEIVRELIKVDADPNARDFRRSTPLLLAAQGGHAVLVKELIDNLGADVKAANEAGSCAVHVAAMHGHAQVFEHLCKAGADIEMKDEQGSRPIHLAANGGHLRVSKILLGRGVDIKTVDGRKLTPLHLAVRQGHLEIVQELLQHSRRITEIIPGRKSKGNVEIGGLDEKAGNESKDDVTPEDGDDAKTYDSGVDSPRSESPTKTPDDEPFYESLDESDASIGMSEFQDSNEATPLHSAAVKGYVEILRELLKTDAQCNIFNKHHFTPLHLAVKEGYVRAVKELLQHNEDPNVADGKESSPLHAASTAGNLSMVKALLSFGADVGKTDENLVSPLHHASRRGHFDVVRQLLKAGADIEATNAIGQTPLHNAISQRHSDVVTALLAKGANPNRNSRQGWTALHFAVGGEDIETALVEQILQCGGDVHASNDHGSTALFLAAKSGSEAVVKILLEAGAKVDARNNSKSTPMHRAAQEGHLTIVELLMEAGGDPLAKKRSDITPLELALANGYLDVAAQLLEPTNAEFPSITEYEEILCSLARQGFEEGITKALKYPLRNLERGDPEYCQSPLSHAAENGHDRVVQKLLDRGADPNSVDKTGRAPLLWAVINGHEVVAKQLLEWHADIHSRDHQQWTALHIAIQTCRVSMVNLLLDKGADISNPILRLTPLHLAAHFHEPAVVRLLVEKGASISSRNKSQETPLDHAVMYGSSSVVELMLDLGADPFAPSPDGWTTIHRAIHHRNQHILDLLVRRCSDTSAGELGWTRLHLAALNGDKDSVTVQLEQGADRTARDRNGLMALHWAAAQSHEDVVQLLLEMNTEVQAKDFEGMTALHHAAFRDNEGIVAALLGMGAERNVADLHGWTPFQIARMYGKDHIRDALWENNETTSISETRAGLAPSRFVKAIDSSNITISEDGLTAIAGKQGLLAT